MKGVNFIENLCFNFKLEIDPDGVNGMSIEDLQLVFQKYFECRRGLFTKWLRGQKAKNDWKFGGWKKPTTEMIIPYSIRCARLWKYLDAIGCPVKYPILKKLSKYNHFYVKAFSRSKGYPELCSSFEPLKVFPFEEFEELIKDNQNPMIWSFMEKDEIWECYHSNSPKSSIIYNFENSLIAALSGKFKFFIRGLKSLKGMDANKTKYAQGVKSLAVLVSLYGQGWDSRVKKMFNVVDSETICKYQRLVENRRGLEIEFIEFWAGKIETNKLLPLFNVIKREEQLRGHDFKSAAFIKELAKNLAVAEYGLVKDYDFAIECAKHKISAESYKNYEDMYIVAKNSQNKEKEFPAVRIQENNYVMRTLDKNDIKGLFLGFYTNCCQRLGGYSQDAAFHGMFDPNGAFVVIEKDSVILFQSWVWVHQKTVIFDNVEAYVGVTDEDREIARQLYYSLASMLKTNYKYKGVFCGIGNADLAFPEKEQTARQVPPPSNVHVYDSNTCWSLI